MKKIESDEAVNLLGKKHISDLQMVVYYHDFRSVMNAGDVVNAVKLIYLMGFKIVKDEKK